MGEERSSGKRSYDARVGERARRLWRATTTADRVVVAVVLVLIAGIWLGPRITWLLDPSRDNLRRFHRDMVEAGGLFGGPNPLWCDAGDHPLSPRFPLYWYRRKGEPVPAAIATRTLPVATGAREFAYEALPSLPRDRWGNRWILVITALESPQRDGQGAWSARYYSAGLNGTFEWGDGDDIELVVVPYDQVLAWWPLAVLASVVAVSYFFVRVARLPRGATFTRELVRVSVGSVVPIVLAFFFIAANGRWLDRLTPSFVLVPGWLAVFLGASFIIWLAIFVFRLRRP
jgi:hypothetical protein